MDYKKPAPPPEPRVPTMQGTSSEPKNQESKERNYSEKPKIKREEITSEGSLKSENAAVDGNISGSTNIKFSATGDLSDRRSSISTNQTESSEISSLHINNPNKESETHLRYAGQTPIQSDSPSGLDLLNRKPFAKYLALRFGKLWKQINLTHEKETGKSFVTHLYSEWGSGKTTFLKLLKTELKDNPVEEGVDWIVIEFNAWQNQHIEPAWWSLMEAIYLGIINKDSGVSKLKRLGLKIAELSWRYYSSKLSVSLPATVMIFVGLIAFNFFNLPADQTGIVTIITGAFSLAIRSAVSLLPGNPKAAKAFQDLTSDPMTKIKNHFHSNIKYTDKPIMVFIDDLDRCREPYVVALLESLHNLFNDQRVLYFVAADKQWISSCFQSSYKSINTHIENEDCPIGHLFLEKLFQISIGLPAVSKDIRRKYVNNLLGVLEEKSSQNISDKDKSILNKAKSFSDLSTLDTTKPEVLEQVMMKSIDDKFDKDIEHILQKYADYLDPNPRFIKLLINTFGINVAVAMSSGIILTTDDYEHIAIWSIISLRYPSVAQDIARDPKKVGTILADIQDETKHNYVNEKNRINFQQLLSGIPGNSSELSKKIICALTGQNQG
jgi:hypothetical protein